MSNNEKKIKIKPQMIYHGGALLAKTLWFDFFHKTDR